MAHRAARLNVFGRRLLVIRTDRWPAAKAAEVQGVSRTTAHKRNRRYRAEGWTGLEDLTFRAWSLRRYSTYLTRMHTWAEALGCQPEEVELCMFRSVLGTSNQWKDD